VVDAVLAVAQARNVAPAQVALAWLLSKDAVTSPIVGATKAHHLSDAVSAIDLELDDDEITLLEASYRPHKVVGFI
jgi:aryl-alcohol dehydrogenase (NADP+)